MSTYEPPDNIDLLPATAFSVEELTEAYNHTRVDYLVPMPMNASKLHEYIKNYDIDLTASAVAVDGNEILGLGMLGIRQARSWCHHSPRSMNAPRSWLRSPSHIALIMVR